MSKPTIFFSHSSKDKDTILKLKDKLMSYTGGTLNIFMSSDGQSIPFGTNWIHKIEEGLNDAKIMFVFVTSNSISSGWIYFEAGFAYSKNIHVIPVGIGIDIGTLKAPLNLLQGFNLTSVDSLNNFISVINRDFDYRFTEQFTQDDFRSLFCGYLIQESINIPFDRIVDSVSFSLQGMVIDNAMKQSFLKNEIVFEKIENYLVANEIPFSKTDFSAINGPMSLSAYGLIVKCIPHKIKPLVVTTSEWVYYYDLEVSISPYNFEKSFELYLQLNAFFESQTSFYIHISLNENYCFVQRPEDYSALLIEYPSRFERNKNFVGSFVCNDLNLTFNIIDRDPSHKKPDYVLAIGYFPYNLLPQSVERLVDWLVEAKVIY